MSGFLMLFAVSVFSVSFLPFIPDWQFMLLLAGIAFVLSNYLFTRKKILSIVAVLLLGIAVGAFQGTRLLGNILPAQLDGARLLVDGKIEGLPGYSLQKTRFSFRTESCQVMETGKTCANGKLLLSWYYPDKKLQPGDQWRFVIKVREPRGFANPAGFNYRKWLLANDVFASGYVDTKRYKPVELSSTPRLIDQLRNRIRQQLLETPMPTSTAALMAALVVGDRSAINGEQWRVLQATGTTHLLVVSGLHIGLFAVICYWPGLLIGRLLLLVNHRFQAQRFALLLMLLGAGFYYLISGMGIPAMRALLMLTIYAGVRLFNSNASVPLVLGLTLAIIAVIDPMAAQQAGFWLSFTAVTALLWFFAPLQKRERNVVGRMRLAWFSQWAIFCSLATILLVCFGRISFIAPLVNLVAVPLVSLLIVPLCLLGVVCSFSMGNVTDWLWQLAAELTGLLWHLLEWLVLHIPVLELNNKIPMGWLVIAILLLTSFILLLPRGLPARYLGILGLTLVIFAQPRTEKFRIIFLDVGQGTAIVVRVADKVLVYDTGPKFTESFNAGSAVIAPYLRQQGIDTIDTLVVSHSDQDHMGGVRGLLSEIGVDKVFGPEEFPVKHINLKSCQRGQQWQWGDVRFSMLNPDGVQGVTDSRNNLSCVLQITFQGQSVLLAGDIESTAEYGLLADYPGLGRQDILLAPHHGSNSSSSRQFVNRVAGGHVVFSAGYRHQFGHPHPRVVERYLSKQSRVWNTAIHGAIEFEWSGDGWRISTSRNDKNPYWEWHPEASTPGSLW